MFRCRPANCCLGNFDLDLCVIRCWICREISCFITMLLVDLILLIEWCICICIFKDAWIFIIASIDKYRIISTIFGCLKNNCYKFADLSRVVCSRCRFFSVNQAFQFSQSLLSSLSSRPRWFCFPFLFFFIYPSVFHSTYVFIPY